jgi:membrane fusion protein, epimerase transport system
MNSNAAPAPALLPHLAEASRLMRRGAAVLLLGLAPIVAWLGLAPLASAVVAPAVLKVDLNRRPVQHAEGGMVREVRVRDGQRVAQGEPLILLGDVSVDADMQRWDVRVRAERASMARLEAEQALAAAIVFPGDVLAAASKDTALAELLLKERSLFDARRSALLGQSTLLGAQREKVEQEALALATQIDRAGESIRLQKAELDTNRGLLKDGFVSATRVTQIEAQIADYAVKLEERRSEHARAEQRLVDTDLRVRALENEYRQQASDQLKVTLARLAEIQQEQRKTSDAANRQVIVAPVAGEVMGLKVHAPGALIAPRDTVAEIVPIGQQLVLEAQVRPEDIDRVQRGQPADVRFTAFNHRSTKIERGRVVYVSADRLLDPQTRTAYYVVHVETDAALLGGASEVKIQAGMPAEVFLEGSTRTPLEYLVEPITQTLRRAARER